MTHNGGNKSTPTDFGVSMRDEVLRHKREDDTGLGMFWEFGNGIPKGMRAGSRMWVANHGRWVGYFVVDSPGEGECEFSPMPGYDDPDEECDTAIFRSASFVAQEGGPRRPFMGYTLKVPPREAV